MVNGWRYYDADFRRSPFHHLQGFIVIRLFLLHDMELLEGLFKIEAAVVVQVAEGQVGFQQIGIDVQRFVNRGSRAMQVAGIRQEPVKPGVCP